MSLKVLKTHHPSRPKAREPKCTESQMVMYETTAGQAVAMAHRYMRRDGTLGASGLPDPKRLYLPTEILSVLPPIARNRRPRKVSGR